MNHPLFEQADAISNIVFNEGKKVYKTFGPGLMEKVYRSCLAAGLKELGCDIEQEKRVLIKYRNMVLDETLRFDILVNNCFIIELKAVGTISPDQLKLYKSQCLTYMNMLNIPLGAVINFGAKEYFFKRVILKGANGWEDDSDNS